MRPYRVLGLSGRIGAGKDMLGNYLVKESPKLAPKRIVRKFAFADSLKELAIAFYAIPREVIYGTQAQKNEVIPHIGKNCRDICETLGNAMCDIHPRAFVWRTLADIHDWSPYLAIITDVRKPDEVQAIHDVGGRVVRLQGFSEKRNTPIENALDGYTGFDYTLPLDNYPFTDNKLELIALLISWGWLEL